MDTVYFEKAAELGNLILASETSLRLADAKAAFEADEAAQTAHQKYNEFQKNMRLAQEGGLMTREKYQEALAQLVELEIDMKNKPAVQEYLKAEADFNNFANSVLEMLRLTIGLESTHSGGCGGCGHGGRR